MTNFKFQFRILFFSIGIAICKFVLFFFTHSNAIFSDALESIVNITANFITLYSLYLAAKPKDKNHPYGHGKIEFIASGIEGSLLFFVGLLTIYKSIKDLILNQSIEIGGFPLMIILVLGIANYLLGLSSEKRGLKLNSPSLVASGKHLKGDGYTSFAILLSLIIIYFTNAFWIDGLIAILAGIYMIYQGYTVFRRSILDILDTADEAMLSKIIDYMQENRQRQWIDIHNFRIIKYGSEYHVDAHLTLPFYISNLEVHDEMKKVHSMINTHYNSEVEIFIHPDPCEPFCCNYCHLSECKERKEPFRNEIKWTLENVLTNKKHGEEIKIVIN